MPDKQTKLISAVLARKLIHAKDYELVNEHWLKMSADQKEGIKTLALECLISQDEKLIKLNICEIINEIITNVYENEEKWDGILVYVSNCFSLELTNENLPNIESALNILAAIFPFVYDDVVAKFDTILNFFRSCMITNVMSLRTRTVRTIAEMFSVSEKKESKRLKEFILVILETTLKCLEDPKEENNVKIVML